jgi:hypothetical protein
MDRTIGRSRGADVVTITERLTSPASEASEPWPDGTA